METKVYDLKWKETGSVTLNKDVFGVEMNDDLVHRALVMQQANARLATAHSKTRGERRGSTRKLFRQKGTGRARMGGNRSPIRKKGWVVFGPRNVVNFTQSMNKKERRKAVFCVLSSKLKNKQLIVVDALDFKEIKTKNMVEVLSKLPVEKKVLLTLPAKNEIVEKSAANIPTAKTILVNYLNVKDLLKYETLILLKDSLDHIDSLAK